MDSPKLQALVLDVLKPHEPDVTRIAREVAALEGVQTIEVVVAEIDSKTETLKVTLEGDDLRLEAIEETLRGLGASIHSVDRVVASRLPVSARHPGPVGG